MTEQNEVETETVTHWGCQFVREDGSGYITRWDPGRGSGVYIPYTEDEARADVAQPEESWSWPGAKRLVTRTETTTVVTTPWTPVVEP